MERQKPLILVSWISLVWSLLSVKLGAKIARWAGFDGLQGAPTRGIPLEGTNGYLQKVAEILPIYLFEATWSDKPEEWEALERIVFENGEAAKTRYRALTLAAPNAAEIFHDLGPSRLVETHPGLWMTPQQVAAAAEQDGVGIVWDTYHVRRRFLFDHQLDQQPDGVDPQTLLDSWSRWHTSLVALGPFIRVVHVQPLRGTDELRRWLNGETTEIEGMLRRLKEVCAKYGDPPRFYVVELPPPDGIMRKLIWICELPWIMRAVRRKLSYLIAE